MAMWIPRHGVIPKRSEEERRKQEQKNKLGIYDFELKPTEDLTMDDFAMFHDDPEPFMFLCDHCEYRNKAFIEEQKQIEIAMADYRRRSRNLTPWDAIRLPEISHALGGITPLDMDEDLRIELTPLCHLALDKYNAEHQGAKFKLANVEKTTWRPCGNYYITFQAREGEQDPSNTTTTTFQAHVRIVLPDGPHRVISCAIKTT